MKVLYKYGIAALVFFLPWQTVWIIQEKMIGPEGAMGLWQYGTIRIYAIEFLILALGIIYLIRLSTKVSFPLRGVLAARRYSSRAILAWVFFFFAGLSIFWSDDRLVALFAWIRLCEGMFLFTLFRTTHLRWSWVVTPWLVAAVIQGALGIWQFATQEVGASSWLGIAAHNSLTPGDAVVEADDRRWLRAYGAFPHPNIFAAYGAVSMIICATILSRVSQKWQWIMILIASQIILIALLLTFSRSAWIAISGASICILLISAKKGITSMKKFFIPVIHPLTLFFMMSIVTCGIFVIYFTHELQTRFGLSPSRLENRSVSERFLSVERAVPVFQRYWAFGTGIGNVTNTLFHREREQATAQPWYAYQPIHNVFLLAFAELGIIGMFLFFALLYIAVRGIHYSPLRVTGYGLLVTLLVFANFDHFFWTLPSGIMLASISLGIFSHEPA